MSDTVVFLGPTLKIEEAREHLDAQYLPPVSQGDVVSVLQGNPKAIGIIDGYFQLVPAVWHKEILIALEQGVRVFGAASMGALRAAEMSAFGMTGIGRVFKWYDSGFLEADDEVAVTHGPIEVAHLPISVALVNIRATLDQAVHRDGLSMESALLLLDACIDTPYWERSFEQLVPDGERLGLDAQEISLLKQIEYVDQKKRDAIEMLQVMAGSKAHEGFAPGVTVNFTSKCEHLLDRDLCLARNGDTRLTTQAVVDFYALHGNADATYPRSLDLARNNARAGNVIKALRHEGRFCDVLDRAKSGDKSSGFRSVGGDDQAILDSIRGCIKDGARYSLSELAKKAGFADSERFLERLHRFGVPANPDWLNRER